MNSNGHKADRAVEQALAQAAAQQQAQQQLLAVLQHTIQNPHTVKRGNTNLAMVATEGEQAVLLVALPSGERWDIVIAPQAARNLGHALLGIEDDEQ